MKTRSMQLRSQNLRFKHSMWCLLALCAFSFGIVLLSGSSFAADPDTSKPSAKAAKVDFNRDIRPLLAKKCFACHGPDGKEAGLRLNKFESAIASLESGSRAIVPGKPEESELLHRIVSTDEATRMPPEGKPLSQHEVDLMRRWIESGGEYSDHWAFQPIKQPSLPPVEDANWTRNGVDYFILNQLEEVGLKPAPKADPATLVRRLYHDVIGLPPSASEVAAFEADPSEARYEALVDKLLSHPGYGERWARHWMDLVRFAETNSYERDGIKPNMWKYRDYLIRAFNDDKRYSDFIREQIAGDELDEVTRDSATATGFYRLGIWDDEPADPELAMFDGFDDVVSTTGQTFLGLTINCARCHDHKIDPISQKDYYQLVAFIRDAKTYGVRGDGTSNNQWDLTPAELKAQYSRYEDEVRKLNESLVKIEQEGIVKMPAPDQRATEGGEREKTLREKLQKFLTPERWTEYVELRKQRDAAQESLRSLPPREFINGLARCDTTPPSTFVLLRGSPLAQGDQVEPGFPGMFGVKVPNIPAPKEGARSAGRRRVLAEWLASDDNWLTSRVMVNRLWQHHFGRGIVRSSNNFGQMGDRPTHPELLDYLAKELVARDWHLKDIHRLMLLSSTYRMSSQSNPQAMAIDPSNDRFWRFNPRRLSAEEVRDAVLEVAGQSNRQVLGPSFYPTIAAEVLAGQSQPGSGWGNSSPEEQGRRSVYIHIKRSLVPPMLSNFDFPETDGSCEARFLTTQPAQALSMLHGDFMQTQAQKLSDRAKANASSNDPIARMKSAIELTFARPATEAELAEGKQLLEDLQTKYGLDLERAYELHCLVLLNQNEFMYVD